MSDRSNTVRMITRLKNDDICIGTRGGGVIVYDPQMKTQKKKLHFNSNIYAIAEDNEGTAFPDWLVYHLSPMRRPSPRLPIHTVPSLSSAIA